MSEQNQEAYDNAMAELDQIEKSMQPEVNELDELTKSLEAELGEDLSKSHPEPDGDEEGEDDDGDGDGKDDEPKKMDKSQEDDFADELIKASEAYSDLEKSIHEGIGGIYAELDSMKKSMAASMNLNIKMAKVIAELSKSRQQEADTINKSIQAMGAAPMAPGKAVIGLGSADPTEAALTKSVSEIHDALLKAVQEGKVAAQNLSHFGTYKDVTRLPAEVRQAIGC